MARPYHKKIGKKPTREVVTCVVDLDRLYEPQSALALPEVKLNNYRSIVLPYDSIEVRKYPPMKRVISTRKDQSFLLPLPYQVFITRRIHTQSSWHGWGTYKMLYVGFALEDDEDIFATPWFVLRQLICVDGTYHYYLPVNFDMSEIIGRYWATFFNSPSMSLNRCFGITTLKEWSNLSIEETMERLRSSKNRGHEWMHLNKLISLLNRQ